MTLNLTLITPLYVIQASDRRMVSLPSYEVCDDEANKGIILQTTDGTFALTFAGVGAIRTERMDMWLAQAIVTEGICELPIARGVELLSARLTQLFKQFPKGQSCRHHVVVSGWTAQGPGMWIITNVDPPSGTLMDAFAVIGGLLPKNKAVFFVTGLIQDFHRSERRRLKAALRNPEDIDKVERFLVALMRDVAQRPNTSWGVNGNVLAVAIGSSRVARATYYPLDHERSNYAPLMVWSENGHNIIAGDAEITHPSAFAWQFGLTFLVAHLGGNVSPSAVPDKQQIAFKFLISDAKFTRGESKVGGVTEMVRAVPLNAPPK